MENYKIQKAVPKVCNIEVYEKHLSKMAHATGSHHDGARPLAEVLKELVSEERELILEAFFRDGFYVQGDSDVYEEMTIYNMRCKCEYIDTIKVPFGLLSGFINIILDQRKFALEHQRP